MTGIVGSAEIPAELPVAVDRHVEEAVRPLISTCPKERIGIYKFGLKAFW
jgi:hypothetical protein